MNQYIIMSSNEGDTFVEGACTCEFSNQWEFEFCKSKKQCFTCRCFRIKSECETQNKKKEKEEEKKMGLEALDDAPPPMPPSYRKQVETDMVNSPSHYRLKDGKEVIDFIEEFGAGPGFTLGNALKYLARAGKKFADKTDEDRKKADWYVNRLVAETKLPIVAVQTMIDGLLVKMGLEEFYADRTE